MFEIRIICDPADTERVTTALNSAFHTSAVRHLPLRHTDMERLYVTADHQPPTVGNRPEPAPWITPEDAYAMAPEVGSEIGWTTEYLVRTGVLHPVSREFWLRKAAVLDRLALSDPDGARYGDADELAADAARRLIEIDRTGDGNHSGDPYWPEHPDTWTHPRGYLRQEYAAWLRAHHDL
ncbi:hypothetical protein AF335_04540 [Streptomyces eurocidicus]|uniref:Uncharacterized protein n=1 Tax=Streptomyces eurocidicus TaxID=66423 RepID=A0A2N8P3I7_STREU|nr:hypothetical protein [Streptomyces eurocidicus]MBB5117793.1 hypothetical protein [Streptomyces eurocidicus]MBF6055620.1 hypothetical protein [Streptomyces eurocidicus]PNE35579.1 hypothetical protein AF335_04540 [Streptomyces eurocidicus]